MAPRKSRRWKRTFFTISTLVLLLTMWAVMRSDSDGERGDPTAVLLILLLVSVVGAFLAWRRTDASGKVLWKKKK